MFSSVVYIELFNCTCFSINIHSTSTFSVQRKRSSSCINLQSPTLLTELTTSIKHTFVISSSLLRLPFSGISTNKLRCTTSPLSIEPTLPSLSTFLCSFSLLFTPYVASSTNPSCWRIFSNPFMIEPTNLAA